jgi:Putative zinc-finger
MIPQHPREEFCLDYLTGELPDEDRIVFEEHIEECSECRLRFEQYREIFVGGLPSIANEMVDELSAEPLAWSFEEGEKRLFAAVQSSGAGKPFEWSKASVARERAQFKGAGAWLRSDGVRRNTRVALATAAGIVIACGLAGLGYKLGERGRVEPSQRIVAQTSTTSDAWLRTQFDKLVQERDTIRAGLLERDGEIAQLKGRIEQQRRQSEATETSLQVANQQAQEQALQASSQLASQRDDLARKLEGQQAALAATQKKYDVLQHAGTDDSLRMMSLENQVQQVTQLLKDKDATIDEQQRMLAFDRDIRDLMSTRGLYISEAYDVGENGKKKKPFARVFSAKGKSLVVYGYDFDKQPGIKNGGTFQAWGMRGPDRNTALNLGVAKLEYVNNAAERHWVLQCDDPKVLEQINAVFVTVEPNGASRVPQGKQVFFAYLNEEPNHP